MGRNSQDHATHRLFLKVFPLKHYIYEGHLLIPFVQKFNSWTATYHWIKWASYLGFGTYKKHKKPGLAPSVYEFAEKHVDYLTYKVNYQKIILLTAITKEFRLKSSFDFTYLYYKRKASSLLKLSFIEEYGKGT